jgi:hypothetical protein
MRQPAAAYILFEDFTYVKFHQRSLRDVIECRAAGSTASTMSKAGCPSGWSPPLDRIHCRAGTRVEMSAISRRNRPMTLNR